MEPERVVDTIHAPSAIRLERFNKRIKDDFKLLPHFHVGSKSNTQEV